ncbi:hypothetical protein PINS_up006624 [Pythium insidiosum]|nr:hypothetical protein PINS_up006624 [Pythium insidiosum]
MNANDLRKHTPDAVAEEPEGDIESVDTSRSIVTSRSHVAGDPLSNAGLPTLPPAELFDLLYAEFPFRVARDASRKERKDNEYISMSLVYGEIAFSPFKTVVDQLRRWHRVLVRPGGVFLDIGSGTGKAVFAAALAHDFDACFGIEILESLHAIATHVHQNVWERVIKKQYALSMQKKRTRITFTLGDALDVDWPSSPDLVFLNSTCFTRSLLRELTKKLSMVCKPGAIVITGTHALPDQHNFEHLRSMTVAQDTWGDATWFIHRKK